MGGSIEHLEDDASGFAFFTENVLTSCYKQKRRDGGENAVESAQ